MAENTWRKSTYSGGSENACLEVRDGVPGVVPVRDSKASSGPVLAVPETAWAAFVRHLGRTG
ncbi:DUF397 domain-containing protein [Streptomyces alkaliphilus]|uniref:DUF397 domain-containing protein n=1 Tax=Streptomyces alkaliphilus TaxID=1472722 RepID=A0A7W3Y345_9ACTN|nr:DUF397 domain-containing protein [Streptomyces alkaliphilus]MBB0245937.1 DUF397 domain-containing protein [Streptomyces alkaliphilus]